MLQLLLLQLPAPTSTTATATPGTASLSEPLSTQAVQPWVAATGAAARHGEVGSYIQSGATVAETFLLDLPWSLDGWQLDRVRPLQGESAPDPDQR